MDIDRATLTDMVAVGAVNANEARIWCRSEHPGRCVVLVWHESAPGPEPSHSVEIEVSEESDRTGSALVRGLSPLETYRYEVRHAILGHLLGTGRFRTSPASPFEAPDRLSFALGSCHLPFRKDGSFDPRSRDMLVATRKCLERHDARFLLLMGDQMYTDQPAAWSLFDEKYFAQIAPPGRKTLLECTSEEVRNIFHSRYRTFWAPPEWQRLQVNLPTYPMWDDHEIVDNWGSSPEHSEPKWRNVIQGAREAFFDYQAARMFERTQPLAEHFDTTLDYGDLAFYVMDLRSQRQTGDSPRIFCQDQLERLAAFLDRTGDRSAVFIMLSVPLLHVPRRVARFGARITRDGEDFSDRWSTEGHEADRGRLLRLFYDQLRRVPERKLVLLSGDIHVGSVHRMAGGDDTPACLQFVSSALTNRPPAFIRFLAVLAVAFPVKLPVAGREEVHCRLLKGGRGRNPYAGLNVGIVETERDPQRGGRRLRFLLYGHRRDEPHLAFQSAWV